MARLVVLIGLLACSTARSSPSLEQLPRVPIAQTEVSVAGGYLLIDRNGVSYGELGARGFGPATRLGADGARALWMLRERASGKHDAALLADTMGDAQCTDARRDKDGKALASREMPARAQLCVLLASADGSEPISNPGATQLALVVDRSFPAIEAVKQMIAHPDLAAARIAVTSDDKKLRTLTKVGLAMTENLAPMGEAPPPARDAVFEVGSKTLPVAGQDVWLWVRPGVTWGRLVETIARFADRGPAAINLVVDDPTPKPMPRVTLPRFKGEVFEANEYARVAANGDLELGPIPDTANGPNGIELARLAAGTIVTELEGYVRWDRAQNTGPPRPPPQLKQHRDTRPEHEDPRHRCGDRREPSAHGTADVPLRATICAGSEGHADTIVLADSTTPAVAVVKWLVPTFGVRLAALAVSADGAHARAFDVLVGGIVSFSKTPLAYPAKTDPVYEVAAVPSTGIAGKDIWIWVKTGVSYGDLMAAIDRGLAGKPHGMSLTLEDPRR
jgi:hypothetical protein